MEAVEFLPKCSESEFTGFPEFAFPGEIGMGVLELFGEDGML
jgi:hypothetical protein